MMKISKEMIPSLTDIFLIIEVTPNTPRMLKILDPIILPMEISISFLRAATADVANSGTEVPKATSVRPTTRSLIPKSRAIFLALSTKRFAPKYNPTEEATIKARAIGME